MTKEEIIGEWANKKELERLIKSIGGKYESAYNLQDLAQDLYLKMLLKDDEFIQRLYNNKKSKKNYLIRMVLNNVYSNSSEYYRKYKSNQHDYEFNENYEELEMEEEEGNIRHQVYGGLSAEYDDME